MHLSVACEAAVQQAVGGVRQEDRAQRQHQRWHARARQRDAPAAAQTRQVKQTLNPLTDEAMPAPASEMRQPLHGPDRSSKP